MGLNLLACVNAKFKEIVLFLKIPLPPMCRPGNKSLGVNCASNIVLSSRTKTTAQPACIPERLTRLYMQNSKKLYFFKKFPCRLCVDQVIKVWACIVRQTLCYPAVPKQPPSLLPFLKE